MPDRASKARRPVGFDLDMTLIDSRPQVLDSFRAVSTETGVAIDIDEIDRRLGLKLEDELANWFDASAVAGAAEVFRRHYLLIASVSTVALPGARAALATVRSAGASSVVITAKHASSVGPCLAAAGLHADEVYSFVHGPEKADVLRRIGAEVYLGDTPADMNAARSAGVFAIGVATGSFTEAELLRAGASTTLATLEAFPSCYDSWLEPRRPA